MPSAPRFRQITLWQHVVTTQQHDLLILRTPGGRIGIQSQPLQRVIEHGLANMDRQPTLDHSIIQGNSGSLRWRKLGMRADFNCGELRPIRVRSLIHAARPDGPRSKHTRQHKILEAFVNLAPCPCMPAKTIKGQSMRCHPPPHRVGARERLITHFQCLSAPNCLNDSTQDFSVHPAHRNGGGIMRRWRRQPAFGLRNQPGADRPQRRKIPVGIGFEKARLEVRCTLVVSVLIKRFLAPIFDLPLSRRSPSR